jgi:uncharacterized membrane protein YsdA (DUF1294 family)
MNYPYYLLITLNILAFLLYGWDKYLAQRNRQRISEKTLLLVAFLGGSLGAGLGMLVFRHKVFKWSFLCKYFLVIALQVGAWVLGLRL